MREEFNIVSLPVYQPHLYEKFEDKMKLQEMYCRDYNDWVSIDV